MLTALRVNEMMLKICDVVVTLCGVLTHPADERPWQDRVETCLTKAFVGLEPNTVLKGLEGLGTGKSGKALQALIKRARKVGYRVYARRLVGAAECDLLERALSEDAAVVALAVRRGVRAALPYCLAWEDALVVMSRQQLAAVTKHDMLSLGALRLLVDLDRMLGEKLLANLPMDLIPVTEKDLSVTADDMLVLTKQLRLLVSEDSASRMERANSGLKHKIQGARDALEHSADGVSQAANSLIELIDRLFRESFDKDTVLAWTDINLPEEIGLCIVRDDGSRRPTKRAEALCWVYGGGVVTRPATNDDDGTGPSMIHAVLAGVVVTARTKLQGLKHADAGDKADREALRQVMASVEGALMLGLWLGLIQ